MRTGVVGGALADRLLNRLGDPDANGYCDGSAYQGRSKLEVLFGPGIWREVAGREVVDFGCGEGRDAIEMLKRGARRVVGVDILEGSLDRARESARAAGVADRCEFSDRLATKADVVVSVDGFEHFADPGGVLRAMAGTLKPGGRVLLTFGPTWLHPLGGHLFSVFPWAHLVFTESALIRWRARFRNDGATRFSEVEGGLNQMTIRRFERLVAESPLEFETFEAVPIRRLRSIASFLPRELCTSFVRSRLRPRHRA
jgi:SAM-dependent methyltransferase